MTPETKEMREATEEKSGPVVSTMWPTTVKFTEDEKSAGELAAKYSHLKQLDPDDKPAYKELVAAIADARNKRLDISKQEDVIKDPINKYRNLLIDTSKKIRGLFGDVESDLKKEKKRIDDIREERKLAMERLWQENLNSVRSMTEGLPSLSMIKLDCLLYELKKFDFNSLDFGDYIEQAKATVELQINAVNERIEFLKEKQRLEEEQHALRLKQAEEAAEQKKRDEEKAEADRKQAETDAENQRLREQLAAMEKANEPEPEMTVVSESGVTLIEDDFVFSDNGDDIEERMQSGDYTGLQSSSRAAAIEQEPESTVNREIKPEDEEHARLDSEILNEWATEIHKARVSMNELVFSPKAGKAVTAVSDQLEQIISYLNKTAESLR